MNTSFLRNAPVGWKVGLAPMLAIACLAVVAALGYWANSRLTGSLARMGSTHLPRLAKMSALSLQLVAINGQVNQSLAWEGIGVKAEVIADLDRRIAQSLESYGKSLAEVAARDDIDSEQKAALGRAASAYGKYRQSVLATLDIKSGMLANAASYMTTIDESYAAISAGLGEAVGHEAAQAEAAIDDGRALSRRNELGLGLGFAVGLAASAALAIAVSRMIVRPLQEASRVALAVADGDLRAQSSVAACTDATGQVLGALDQVTQGLSAIVDDVRRTAEEVSVATAQIGSGTADLSMRTEHAAGVLQQTAASIEQLAQAIRASADNACQADSLAREASAVAKEGGFVVGDVIASMDHVDRQARQISEIIGVIDGIAFQTNILALNAAVEAARAGAQGRGFAVVAGEVRTLAQRSAAAAKEIRVLIGSSVEQVEASVQKARAAGETMDRIVSSVGNVTSTIEGISRAAQDQAGGVAQISAVVADMDRATQQNAALVEQASAATESLNEQAKRLVGLLSRFRTA